MRTRKILLGVVAVAALATPLAMAAAPANAYTTNADGSLHVTKGEVQSAFHWSNKEFDQNVGSLEFNVDGTSSQSNHFEGIAGGVTYKGDLVTTTTRTMLPPTRTLSDNGKQINGWDLSLSAATSSTDYANGTLNRAMNQYTMAKYFGAVDGGSAFSLVTLDEAGAVTVTFGDKTVALPITPAPIA